VERLAYVQCVPQADRNHDRRVPAAEPDSWWGVLAITTMCIGSLYVNEADIARRGMRRLAAASAVNDFQAWH
jgi:hypothetical protein